MSDDIRTLRRPMGWRGDSIYTEYICFKGSPRRILCSFYLVFECSIYKRSIYNHFDEFVFAELFFVRIAYVVR